MLGRLLLVCIVFVLVADDVIATVQQIIAAGFQAETHHVTTSDGYILEMHRIPYGREAVDSEVKRPVVFLMHGLMSASDQYVALGVTNSLAYNLADEGFDVWMGNARGNLYSRNHTSLNPDDNTEKFQFFDFTFEEIATHDLPAMIDYALEYTGNTQLHYIGLSQGGTVFLVLTSMKPEYNDKIASAHLLAGVGYQEYFPDAALAAMAVSVDDIYNMALIMGIVELYPELLSPTTLNGYSISDYCTGNLALRKMCELFGIRHILRSDLRAEEYVPAGASLKQAAHYGQNIRDKLFRRYHHGSQQNLVLYGVENPPLYNLGLITCDVTMHYSMNDNLLDERDVLAMVADMPNAKARKVARESFEHADYVYALDAKELVTDFIIEALKDISFNFDGATTAAPDAASTLSLDMYLTLCALVILFMTFRINY